ncbi:MAG TPA: polyphosphate kinase 2 family protein [Candidatus Binataceae bacterium]|nr:polyphosphate kinase 2 family protein [Candidatus Binataceae bacterium]
MNREKLIKPFCVTRGKHFRLKDFDPAETHGLKSDADAADLLARGIKQMSELQDRLYAQDRWALLIMFQAMDAAGKDSAIKHVMSGVNPQGCEVYAFKQPSAEELDHDFLWRASKVLPRRGHIGIFNRSYYEEVLVVRIHDELLRRQRLPDELVGKRIWKERFEDIADFERYLSRNGVVIRKFFLNVSKEEQKRRFIERLKEPEKNWKLSLSDVAERERWEDYMTAYEEMIAHTASEHAPWYVVPADHKWFTRVVVAEAILDTMEKLDLSYPKIESSQRKQLKAAMARLQRERE